MVNSQSSTNDYYKSKVSVLEGRVSDAKYEDVIRAVKLYDNFRKMPMARRAKVDYEALKSQAQTLYSTLADKVADSPAETVVEPSKPVAERKGLISRMAGKARTYVIAGIASAALAAVVAAAYYPQISNYFSKPKAAQTETVAAPAPVTQVYATTSAPAPKTDAPAAAAPKAPARNSVEPEFNIFNWINSPATAPAKTAPAEAVYSGNGLPQPFEMMKGITSSLEALKIVKDAYAQAKPAPAPVQKPKTVEQPKHVELKPGNTTSVVSVAYTPQEVEAVVKRSPAAQSAPAQRTPARAPAEQGVQVRDVLNLGGLYTSAPGESESSYGGNITNKLIVDFKNNTNANLYTSGFTQKQSFEDYDITGLGGRVWATLGHYFKLGEKAVLLAEAGAGYETRKYDAKFDSGSKLEFGNNSAFATAKLGVASNGSAERQFENDENYGINNQRTLGLLQFTNHWGTSTGDVKDLGFEDGYKAMRLKFNGQAMVTGNFAIKADASYFTEEFGNEFLKQNNVQADAGARFFTTVAGAPARVDALVVVQKLQSESDGSRSRDTLVGPQVGIGARIAPGVDWTADVTYLFSQEDKNQAQATTGFTFYFGK